MSFVSNPKQLTLPEEAFYPVDRLCLFDRHNRRTWEDAFGEQARKWDKERRIKRWADTSVLEGVEDAASHMLEYDYFDPVTRTFKKLSISAEEASLPNLPGTYVYPKYVVEPTPAMVVDQGSGDEQPLNPEIICHKAEAVALATALQAYVIQSSSFEDGPFIIDWKGEVRRRWLMVFPDITCNAAALVRNKNSGGIGAPGEWTWVKVGTHKEPRWLSHQEETGDHDPRPEIPIPCRRLFEEEAIWTGFGGTVMIYRTDMESPYNPAPEGGLSVAQAAALARIDANVQKLLAEFAEAVQDVA